MQRVRADLEAYADDYHDMGTDDLLTGSIEPYEEMTWRARAYLIGASV